MIHVFEASFSATPTWRVTTVRPVYIDFPPSVADDVVEYRLYYEESPGPVTKDSAFVSLGDPEPVDDVISVDIANIPEFASVDGTYELGLAALDDVGNISQALTIASGVSLDFVAPPAPASISVRYG